MDVMLQKDVMSETIFSGKFIRVRKRGTWEYVERTNANGVVGIVAITEDRKLILTEQFRPPVNTNVIELPAGLTGDIAGQEDETVADAARRELLEETGYEARHVRTFITGTSSAGLTSEVLTLCIATGLRRVAMGGGVDGEAIQIHEIPLDQVHQWTFEQYQTGKLVDFKIFVALYLALTRSVEG